MERSGRIPGGAGEEQRRTVERSKVAEIGECGSRARAIVVRRGKGRAPARSSSRLRARGAAVVAHEAVLSGIVRHKL